MDCEDTFVWEKGEYKQGAFKRNELVRLSQHDESRRRPVIRLPRCKWIFEIRCLQQGDGSRSSGCYASSCKQIEYFIWSNRPAEKKAPARALSLDTLAGQLLAS